MGEKFLKDVLKFKITSHERSKLRSYDQNAFRHITINIELKGYVFYLLETTASNICQLNFKLAVMKAKRLTAGLANSLQQLLRFFSVPPL